MANMMTGIQTEGKAESGYGITIGGFYCPTHEFAGRFEALKKTMPPCRDFAIHEEQGYVMVLVMSRSNPNIPQGLELETYRREPHKFFADLPKFLAKTRAQFVDRMILTGSLGSISLTLLYRPVQEVREAGV